MTKPKDLKVVAWLTMASKDGKQKLEIGCATTNPEYVAVRRDFVWEPLVRQSDALRSLAAQVDALTVERDAHQSDSLMYRGLLDDTIKERDALKADAAVDSAMAVQP